MRARELIGANRAVILEGFEDAWAEIGPDAGPDPIVMEAARVSLARIVVSVAQTGPIDRGRINAAAVDAFRAKHRTGLHP